METLVDNPCIDVAPNDGDDNDNDNDNDNDDDDDDGGHDDDDSTVDDDSTGDATCGECLAYITARLWKMAVPAASLRLDITTSAFSAVYLDLSIPLWLQHRIRMFYYSMMSLTQKRTLRTPRIEELLHTFTAEIFWSDAPDDCVKGYTVGQYLASRLFAPDLDRCKDATCTSSYNHEVWKDIDSFDSYISSYALDDTESYYTNTFDNEEDAHNANVLASTNLDPTTSLITTTVGQVLFDSTCSGNKFEFDINDTGGGNDDDAASVPMHFIRPTNCNTASIKTENICGNPSRPWSLL